MRKTIEEVVGAIEELYASGKYDAEFRKKLITNSLQACDEALLAELEGEVTEMFEEARKREDRVERQDILSLISSKSKRMK